MSLALEVWRALIRVKVENVSGTSTVSSGEEMTTVAELDFSTLLYLDIFEKVK